ncbi:helix-turn-helix domain-containing protein [Dysgonomonas sp. GY617]|uniref:helix-turn-helix domain-containing protein n=1 Tax=Dysgonomonas sp. GY617 TaxID=2780420 RepID=UPI001883CD9E|nr:helix-turn-helix domain-containing protein [Dysgonomonas sp. GY617]MBF0577711.1 helix-turn-helix domain-containing protein [Dysgonomonas sp. GY617]
MTEITIPAKEWNELKSQILKLDEKVSYLVSEKQKETLSPKEVQKLLNIGKSTYIRYLDHKVFEQKKIKGKAYVLRSEIERLIAEGKI